MRSPLAIVLRDAYLAGMTTEPPKSSRRRRRKPKPEIDPPGSYELNEDGTESGNPDNSGFAYGGPGTEPRYEGDRWPYDEEIAQAFLDQVRQGQPVQYLAAMVIWPSLVTLWLWRESVPEFKEAYFAALEEAKRVETEVADASFDAVRWLGWAVLYDTRIDPKRAKVALDAFKWLAQKGHPSKFGNNLDLTNSDGSFSFAKIERYVIGAKDE